MKKNITIIMAFVLLFSVFAFNAYAENKYKNGTYPISVQILKSDGSGVSMANAAVGGASLVVNNGAGTLYLNLNPITVNGMKAYLGRFGVQGYGSSVVSNYDVYDDYNDPSTGTDALMKGNKYPRGVAVNVDLSVDRYTATFYVPLMAELGNGNQTAFLKLSYPAEMIDNSEESAENQVDAEEKEVEAGVDDVSKEENTAEAETTSQESSTGSEDKETSSTDEGEQQPANSEQTQKQASEESKSEENSEIDKSEDTKSEKSSLAWHGIEDGFYSLDISLYKSSSDELSMGDNALVKSANLHVKDQKATLYFSSKKMTVGTLSASLREVYYYDGQTYVLADKYISEADVLNNDFEKPLVFSIDLQDKSEFVKILIDPRVDVMGREPIEARLKVDFGSLKKVDVSQAAVVEIIATTVLNPTYNSDKTVKLTCDLGSITVPAGVLDNEASFYMSTLGSSDVDVVSKHFDKGEDVEVYSLSLLKRVDVISNEILGGTSAVREKVKLSSPAKLVISIPDGKMPKSVYVLGGEKKEVDFSFDDSETTVEVSGLESPIAVVYESSSQEEEAETSSGETKDDGKDDDREPPKDEAKEESSNNYMFILLLVVGIIVVISVAVVFIKKYTSLLKEEKSYRQEIKDDLEDVKSDEDKN